MKHFATFENEELDTQVFNTYYNLCELMTSAARLHVQTIKKNNHYYFESMVTHANILVENLKKFYSLYDKRREKLTIFNAEDLIKKAKEFFKEEIDL